MRAHLGDPSTVPKANEAIFNQVSVIIYFKLLLVHLKRKAFYDFKKKKENYFLAELKKLLKIQNLKVLKS